jgi:hypothetical protein
VNWLGKQGIPPPAEAIVGGSHLYHSGFAEVAPGAFLRLLGPIPGAQARWKTAVIIPDVLCCAAHLETDLAIRRTTHVR